jgi:hypothetical protein
MALLPSRTPSSKKLCNGNWLFLVDAVSCRSDTVLPVSLALVTEQVPRVCETRKLHNPVRAPLPPAKQGRGVGLVPVEPDPAEPCHPPPSSSPVVFISLPQASGLRRKTYLLITTTASPSAMPAASSSADGLRLGHDT